MTFIDNLGIELDVLILVTVAVFYTGIWVWWGLRKQDPKEANASLRGGGAVLGLLGGFLLLLGLWGEFTWPLPASYNMLFYDPTVLAGIILVGFAVSLWFKIPSHLIGIIAFVSGWGVIYYGARAYLLGLTNEPLDTFAMYLAFGALAVLSMPVTLFVDWYVTRSQTLGASAAPSYPKMWNYVLGPFLLFAVLAGAASILMGFNTIWSHLAKAP